MAQFKFHSELHSEYGFLKLKVAKPKLKLR